MPLKSFRDSPIAKDLQDPEFAAGYLEDALKEDVQDFMIAIRDVADANGGLGKLSRISELGRESLYKTLSEKGNPKWHTLVSLLIGLKFAPNLENLREPFR